MWGSCILQCVQTHPRARPNFSQPSSLIALVYQSVSSRTITDRLLYDWIAETNLVEREMGNLVTAPLSRNSIKNPISDCLEKDRISRSK